jgi:hypothetical protein
MPSLKLEDELLYPYNKANINRWIVQCTNLEESIKKSFKPWRAGLQAQLDKYRGLINDGNIFLRHLAHAPNLAVDAANAAIDKFVEDYEYRHPIHQGPITRSVLRGLKRERGLISSESGPGAMMTPEQLVKKRQEFLYICGMLCASRQKLLAKSEQENPDLAEELLTLYKYSHMTYLGDLPDEFSQLQNGESSAGFYERLKAQALLDRKIVQNPKDADLLDYDEVLLKLNKTLLGPNLSPIFASDQIQVARDIRDAIVKEKERIYHEFDMKFATTVMLKTDELLRQPFSVQAQQDYLRLASHADGRPSFKKKLKAFMLGLLGITLIAIGVYIAVSTLGVATPVSANIIHSGTAALILMSTILGLTGIGANIRALGLFGDGMRKDLSKQMHNLVEKNEKLHENQAHQQTLAR